MFRYAVIGAGMQGTAAAYDLARFGDAEEIQMADRDPARAEDAAQRLNRLLGRSLVRPTALDARDEKAVVEFLRPIDAAISAVPYRLNPLVARAAIEARTSLCDLGGHTPTTWEILALDQAAREAGVSLIPDCGLMPGLGNTLAVYAMRRMDQPRHVRIWCGGLPQRPRGPLGYRLVFNIAGLTAEYTGKAVFLRQGRIVEIEALTEPETITFPPPVGTCEAFVTSGGTSTCPWTFQGILETYEEKTVRYPGHLERIRVLAELGFLETDPIDIDGIRVIPREVFHRLVEPRLQFPEDPADVVVLRVTCEGTHHGQTMEITLELMDFYDPKTGFTAMERTTGWHAAIVAGMMARGETPKGAIPVERAVDPERFVAEWLRRGIPIQETVRRPLRTNHP
ncbi:saccharopine dehydrogenase C-terminal domain-containing protein [Thermoflexus sp.]|uniref:saccharopine dehydrogenase family protein n=1 Tax=Thermoflexus sp. TaxID=1969742 RepID=UPI0035E4460D